MDVVCPGFGEVFGTTSCACWMRWAGKGQNSQAWRVLIIGQTLVAAPRGVSQGSTLSCLTSSLAMWVMGLSVTPALLVMPN